MHRDLSAARNSRSPFAFRCVLLCADIAWKAPVRDKPPRRRPRGPSSAPKKDKPLRLYVRGARPLARNRPAMPPASELAPILLNARAACAFGVCFEDIAGQQPEAGEDDAENRGNKNKNIERVARSRPAAERARTEPRTTAAKSIMPMRAGRAPQVFIVFTKIIGEWQGAPW